MNVFRGTGRLLPLVLLLLALPRMAPAQQGGIVAGRVVGPDGNPLESVTVRVSGTSIAAITDNLGSFRLASVPAGQQTVELRYLGFETQEIPVTVVAGAIARLDVSMSLGVIALRGITVEGERGGQLRSINEQRTSATVVNVVSADEIGRLPDQNVAEAVQRVSGIYVQSDRGEGRFVSIRGTAPRLNNVTLNGQTLASTAQSRATALDLLPADMVSGVEVVKAVTPDMDGNSIGGSVNITTITAFDREGPLLNASVEGMHHLQQVDYLDDKLPFEASLTAGRRFGAEGTLGLVVSGNFSRRDFGVSALEPNAWDYDGDWFVPTEIEAQVEDTERERYGMNASLDWHPTPGSRLGLAALYTRTEELASNSEFEFGFGGELVNPTPTGGRYTGGYAELDLNENLRNSTLYSLALTGEHRLSNAIIVDASGNYTRGLLDQPELEVAYETEGGEDDEEGVLANTFDISKYFFQITPDDPTYVKNGNNYILEQLDFHGRSNVENTWSAATNLRWDTRLGTIPAFLKVGGKAQIREKSIDVTQDVFRSTDLTPRLGEFAIPTVGSVQGGYDNYIHGDVARFAEFARSNRNNTDIFVVDEFESTLLSTNRDSHSYEDVYAGYLMGNAEFGRLTVTAGARVEHTLTESIRAEVVEDEDAEEITVLEPSTFDNSYTNLLPAIILKYLASDQLIFRAAWTNSIARPDYDELSGFRSLAFAATATPDVYEGSVSLGNPDLQPYESTNLDATAEYYFGFGGVLSAAAFYKYVDNPIYEWEITERNVEYEGRTFEELSTQQTRNADAGEIRGVEFSYAQALVFLPRPLDGLGITANVSLIDSEVTVPGRDERGALPFFGQSGRVINLIPYYQRGPIELRAAVSHRNEYLESLDESEMFDEYADDRTTIDLSGSYSFPGDHIEVFMQARNLTNEPEVFFQGEPSRYAIHTLFGRTLSLGVRATY